jgi:hypothetical protein
MNLDGDRFDLGAGLQEPDHLGVLIGTGVGDRICLGARRSVDTAPEAACALVDASGWQRVRASCDAWHLATAIADRSLFIRPALW